VDCKACPRMSSYFASLSQLCQVSLPAVALCSKAMSCCHFRLLFCASKICVSLRTKSNVFYAISSCSKRHHQHLLNSWNKEPFCIKDVFGCSKFRSSLCFCQSHLPSVSPTYLHRSPPVFSYFARDILRLSQRLLSPDL
jgi:hypothetical protein